MNPCSTRSVKRFIRFLLSINQPVFYFHQTLTSKKRIENSAEAKKLLKTFLDTLHNRFEMASLYVEERQEDGTVHYHVLFFIFDRNQLPVSEEKARGWMQKEVFKRWNKVNGDTLSAVANRLTRHQKDQRGLEYLLKGISVRKTQGRTVNWWGCRNNTLIRANST